MTPDILWHHAADAAEFLAAVGLGFLFGLIWRGPRARGRR
jgi:hypothetical protein